MSVSGCRLASARVLALLSIGNGCKCIAKHLVYAAAFGRVYGVFIDPETEKADSMISNVSI